MSTKRKKRHPNSSAAARARAEANAIADQKDRARKRMNPVARNILFGDLVYLAFLMMLEEGGAITPQTSGWLTLIGALLIPVALYFQFGPGSRKSSGGTRLK